MRNYYYLTTTLPYVNADPHIGFALEIVQADVLARFHRLLGENVFFNTGTDEHGLKIYQRACQENKPPQEYVNEYAAKFNNLKTALNLSYNSFIRTTDKHHLEAAKEFWRRCQRRGDIYKAKQKIKYCVGCELEKSESELIDNRCPLHPNRNLEIVEEENYFFRFSKYQKPLLRLYEDNPDFVVPKSKFKEIKSFVAKGLKDFSISRLKTKMPWGVEVPGDPGHIQYVWFDALVSYISAIGWPQNLKKFKKWWPVTQLAGKDNLRQQAAMWQAMLLSAGLPNSKQIFIHGFITADGQKMSKSLGNVINPFDLVQKYGTDPVRYYLLREIPAYDDGDFSYLRFKQLYNSDLANGLGNLVQRIAKLAQNINLKGHPNDQTKTENKIIVYLKNFEFNKALEFIWKKISFLDQSINQSQLWEKTGKDLQKTLDQIIFSNNNNNSILGIAYLLQPFLPETATKIENIFTSSVIKAPFKPLFPRI